VKQTAFAIGTLALASIATSADRTSPELTPDTFRFLRTEQRTFPPTDAPGGPLPPTTVTYGVFAFRYTNPKPLHFFGFHEPNDKKFTTRFTGYLINKKFRWERLPVLFCGTGAATYVLQPGVDYELRISLSDISVAAGSRLRVSADSPDGHFWSEPFTYPTK